VSVYRILKHNCTLKENVYGLWTEFGFLKTDVQGKRYEYLLIYLLTYSMEQTPS